MKEIFNNKTSKLTFMGIMLAITALFVVATAIPNFAVSVAVIMFLPTIITGIILGPVHGAIMGLFAGVFTMLRALFMPMSPFDYFFINPLVSVLPRIFIGVIASFVFKLFGRKLRVNAIFSSSIAGGAGILTNTFLVILMLYLVNGQVMVEAFGMGFIGALITLFLSNGIIELLSAIIVVPIIYGAFKSYAKSK
ncbi:MAG: ECF transporter S component [Eubacteriaceae bacterium]